MTQPQPSEGSMRERARRSGRPWLIALGFLLAFAATVATVLLTGLYVRAPRDDAAPEPAQRAAERPLR